MKWTQEELQAWVAKTKDAEDDAQVLAKYQRADEAKVKELTLKIERLTQESQKLKRDLDSEITNTHGHQIGLDKVTIMMMMVVALCI